VVVEAGIETAELDVDKVADTEAGKVAVDKVVDAAETEDSE
jgi:hypothetical protein